MQLDSHDDNQNGDEDVTRRRNTKHCPEHGNSVDPGVVPYRGNGAEQHAGDKRQYEGQQSELDRHWQEAGDDLVGGVTALEAGTKIEASDDAQ